MSSPDSPARAHGRLWSCVLAACAIHLAAAFHVARSNSATSDEVPHLAAGITYLRGDLRLNREHPPLIKVLAALATPARSSMPVLAHTLPSPEVQWDLGRYFLYRGAKRPPLETLARARAPLLLLNLLLLVCLALAQFSAGTLVACVSVCSAALCPLWIAHATLVTTDATASTFFFASTALAVWLLRAETLRSRVTASVALATCIALALASKYSMLSLLGLVPCSFALDALRLRRARAISWMVGAVSLGGLLGTSLAWGWPPNPFAYIEGVRRVGYNHRHDAYPFYAFSSFFQGTDPLYFARALLVKVSAPVLVLALVALGSSLHARRTANLRQRAHTPWLTLWLLPPLGYYVLMATNAPAIGVRYVLPVLPFLFMAAGHGAAALWRSQRARWLLLPLAAAHGLSLYQALSATPLAFFNGVFCSTGQVPPCLDDSNVDWGQALPQLAAFMHERYPGSPVRIFYFGSSPPEAYVPDATLAEPNELLAPKRALYAVSLHLLVRMPQRAWPRLLAPLATPGGSYAIFDLRRADRSSAD